MNQPTESIKLWMSGEYGVQLIIGALIPIVSTRDCIAVEDNMLISLESAKYTIKRKLLVDLSFFLRILKKLAYCIKELRKCLSRKL